MNREELKQEAKESDHNPEIKAKIRSTRCEMARRRIISKRPTADVVVTNPTHYAVALKYTDGKRRAPTVVFRGADEVAAMIRELAADHKVPLLAPPPLARVFFRHTELGDQSPESLYTAVVEVLAYGLQLPSLRHHDRMRAVLPTDLDVPMEMDPNHAPDSDARIRKH